MGRGVVYVCVRRGVGGGGVHCTCFNLSSDRMLEMFPIAFLNFSTAFSSSSSSTKDGFAGIFGGGLIPSDFGIPITTSNMTPQAVRVSCPEQHFTE